MYFFLVRSCASTMRRQSSTLVAIGTVHATCLPFFERLQRHARVVGDRRVDVDEVDVLSRSRSS
jgi:hypothetical protein